MKTKRLLLALLCILGMTVAASADIYEVVADFNDGNTETAADGFVGAPGNGWTDRWMLPSWTAFPTTTGTVITSGDENFNEVTSGGGNYLSVHFQDTAAVGIGRDFGLGDLDASLPYTIEFSYRVDDGFDESFNSSNDRIQFFNAGAWRPTSDASCSWVIGAYGGATTWMDAEDVGYWLFYDGANDGVWSATQQVNTGLAVTEGVTYNFSVYVDPVNYTYTPSVTDTSTGTTFAATAPLGWRTTATSMPAAFTLGGRTSATGDFLDYSVDKVRVWQDATGIDPIGGMSEVVANFDGGNATDVVDGFTGMAGNGWATDWQVNVNAVDPTQVVVNGGVVTSADAGFQELHAGDGNYLTLDLNNPAASAGEITSGAVSRSYKARPGIDYRESHTIEFTVRIDEPDVGGDWTYMNAYDDRYWMAGATSAKSVSSTTDTFFIMATGAAGKEDGSIVWGDQIVEKWAFADGAGDGTIADMVGSGIELVTGGVYDFTIFLDVDTQTYDVTVTDGTTTFTAEDLGWRTSATNVGGYLNFGGQTASYIDTRAMSIDNIRISQELITPEKIPGDANNDGKVDGSDVTILAGNWQKGVSDGLTASWEEGDFNEDGKVDGSDVTILAGNWQYGVDAAAAAVPEPSTLIGIVMLLLAGAGFTRRR